LTIVPEVASNMKATVGEGPTWDAENKLLYWVDIDEGIIYSHRPNDAQDQVVHRVKQVSSVVLRSGGGLALTAGHGFYALDLESKVLTPLAEQVETEKEGNRFNDGKVDPAGRYWVGTMDAQRTPIGALYVLEKQRGLKKVLDAITVSNGLCWSPDSRTMYYIDSATKKVTSLDYSLKTGEVGNRRTIIDFVQAGQEGGPDGMTIDEEGMLWVAHWGGARVTRWDPSTRRLLETVPVPADQTSSCCFGGSNLDELYITSAARGLDPAAPGAKPLNGALFVAKVGVRGLPAHVFDG
jgi:sugar lactone lactonase YvrE